MQAQDPGTRTPSTRSEQTEAYVGGGGALIRVGWMLGGTLTMLIAAFSIASSPQWTFGLRDVVFFGGALLAVALRYVDITRYQGQTSAGEPASMSDFWRYLVGLIATAGSCWIAAQSVQL